MIEALVRLAHSLADSVPINDLGVDNNARFVQTLRRLKTWVDIDSTHKYSHLCIERDIRSGLYGLVLKQINTILDNEIKYKDDKTRA